MENLKAFNLDLALFLKTLHSYTVKVNEIDDETTQLLVETILAVNKLQNGSKYRGTSFFNENRFLNDLNEEQFICRRHIVCRLCHIDFPLSAEEFKTHVEKKSHKDEVVKLKSTQMNSNGNATIQAAACDSKIVVKDRFNSNLTIESRPSSTSNSMGIPSYSSNLSLNGALSKNASASNETSVFSMQNMKTTIGSIENVIKQNSQMPSSSKNIESIIKMKDISKAAKLNMMNLLSRSDERVQNEEKIIETLSIYFKRLDLTIDVVPFGSSTYGFGGTQTDFNILIRTGISKSYSELLYTCENSFKSSDISSLQHQFDFIERTSANRVQRQQIKILHKQSHILCTLLFDSGFAVAQASEKILRFTSLNSMCKELIAYVKALHNELNGIAINNGLPAVNFNSYMISILVIFYLQSNHNYPKLNELFKTSKVTFSPEFNLSALVKDFFKFYGCTYEVATHLISLNIGRWQEKRLQMSQTRFSPEQKSLRDFIAMNQNNWTNCAMWVQDIAFPGINIMAEISEQDAKYFKNLCLKFSSYTPRFDEVNGPSAIKTIPIERPNQTEPSQTEPSQTEILNLVEKKLDSKWSFLESRHCVEIDLISTVTKYIDSFDASLGIVKIGSSQYGIKGPTTNVNLLVNTYGNKPKSSSQSFFFKIDRTDISKHFKQIFKSSANRVLKRQINMIHINSGVQCTLLFDKDNTIAESTKVIKRYVEIDPMCRFLITFIKCWQEVLSDLNIANFKFNTYIISVLVIFFLQVTHKLPLVKDIFSVQSSTSTTVDNFKNIPRQFFEFYGNRYQMLNHVISAHIGQWQERRLQPEQTHLGEATQRLRNGIETSPENWTNCTMYVQDLVRFDVNITAEIPKAAAEQFQLMCQKFAK